MARASRLWLFLAVLALVALPAGANELGDPAPALKISKWAKGEAVDLEKRKGAGPTVVEFWATWCGPCKASIPHLTELAHKYKDQGVVFVGVSQETADVVQPFVDKMGAQMDYVVAVDAEGATNEAYMDGYGVDGIPHAFVVGSKGEVLWHGHPMSGLEQALDEVLAGKYDMEATRRAMRAQGEVDDYFKRVAEGINDEETKALGARIVEDAAKDPGTLNILAWTILTEPGVKARDLDLAMKAAVAAVAASEGKDAAILDTYARALFDTGKVAEAIEQQKKAIEAAKEPEMKAELEATLKQYEEKARAGGGDAK